MSRQVIIACFLVFNGMQRIVIIDDDKDLSEIVRSLLRKRGFKVSIFSDWITAIKNVRKYQPQLILLDVFLGSTDGLEICKKLKSNSLTKHIPVLVFSGFAKVADTAIYEFGANDFIAKPFEANDLIDKIYEILAPIKRKTQRILTSRRSRSPIPTFKRAFIRKVIFLPMLMLVKSVGFVFKKVSGNTRRGSLYS